MRLALAAAALFALAACQPAEKPAEPVQPTPEEMGQDEPGPFTPPPVGPAKVYDAMSKTAMSFTPGKLTVTPTPQASINLPEGAIFAFDNGIKYETTSMPGGAEQGDATKQPKWASLFQDLTGAPIDATRVMMYSVDNETVPAGTPNGGLCKKTSFLATYTVANGPNEDMTIAAFEGDEWPPAVETALCGTYTYSLVK